MRGQGELMRHSLPMLHGENMPVAEFLKQQGSVLGAICFSLNPLADQMQADSLCMPVPMQNLDSTDTLCEVWRGSGQITQGRYGDIRYRHDDSVLFGVITLPENRFSATPDKSPLQQAAELAYRQVFELAGKLRYPYLLRFWNYIADINASSFGMERYHQFNIGRQDAFLAHGRDVLGNAPAACALGLIDAPLSIAFLAGRAAPLSIENPRQISASQYPQQYGPRSPIFSRASLVRMGQSEVLFISGTASIVGHATLHHNDVVAQTRETMTNIKLVLAEANRQATSKLDLIDLSYRVYVRHPADLTLIRAELERCVGGKLKAVYLQAEVCRQDLLLEIEAMHSSVSDRVA